MNTAGDLIKQQETTIEELKQHTEDLERQILALTTQVQCSGAMLSTVIATEAGFLLRFDNGRQFRVENIK